jgi:hypothetical protein
MLSFDSRLIIGRRLKAVIEPIIPSSHVCNVWSDSAKVYVRVYVNNSRRRADAILHVGSDGSITPEFRNNPELCSKVESAIGV